ncbi:FluC/FEX family fluoride channel [Cellulomonas alba]|uniref:Fluoride-specific ion channel FluC n=1 Tax=Cellulomonas alba TaxID=3053467 RepID=A0ABT7SEX2_9CELL|nr:CrcB family protein [Cellulomonas alba]MDM7854117.1 CrcB family protein [Cellulomonas alba]
MSRAHHLDPLLVGVVAIGGALGTLARYGVIHALHPAPDGLPVATLTENLVGAFLLGLLLEALLRAGAEDRRRRVLRLGLGTGVLGGFTTYSSLALEVHTLASDGRPGLAAAYGLGSMVLGLVTCVLGVLVAAWFDRRRAGARAHGPAA